MKSMFWFLPLTLLLASCQPSVTSSSPSSTSSDELRKSLRLNTAPKVNAGLDRTVMAASGTTTAAVTLQGSVTDAENNITSYLVKEGIVTLKSGTTSAVFSAIVNLKVGTHTLTLEAKDSGNLTGRDSVIITVQAYAPPTPTPDPTPTPTPAPSTGTFKWKPLRLGAGGWLVGMDISNDGLTKVVRADTYGAYVWDNTLNQWRLSVSSRSMPGEDVKPMNGDGVYEIRVAPNASTRLYMAYKGFVYRSNDRGATWNKTAFARVEMFPNDNFRNWGQKMAIDPANPDVVFVGTPKNGLFVTRDGGASYQQISQVPVAKAAPNGEHPGLTGIAIDGRAVINGRSQVIYAASYGNGVYRSADGGVNWALLSNSPTTVLHGKLTSEGIYFAAASSTLNKFENNVFTQITNASLSDYHTIMPDPFNPARIVAAEGGGRLSVSNDRGATWSAFGWNQTHVATDIPWHGWTKEDFMSNGDMYFDPIIPNRIYFSEGIGVWYTDLPASSSQQVVWKSMSLGIEQLCLNQFISPPGGVPVVASWDRPIFVIENPDVFPATHGPDNTEAISMGWSLDYASSQPSFITAIMNWGTEKSGYSTDGGRTWYKFASYPPFFANGKIGGGIAASTPMNIVWAPNNNGYPYYTKDGGATWKPAVLPGVVNGAAESGFGWAYYFKRFTVTADRVLPNTFYIYNYLKGLYRTTDGGDNWTLIKDTTGFEWTGYHARLKSVPGKAGHLFWTSGTLGAADDANHGSSVPLRRSIDGGVTWQNLTGVNETWDVSFGKNAPGADYPTIFVVGWVNGRFGIYRSDDNAVNWVFLGDYPLYSLDAAHGIQGDMNTYGKVYVGLGGSGGAYGVIE